VHPRHLLIALTLICLPLSAHAATKTTWSFLGGKIGPEWRITGNAQSMAEIGGLRIAPQEDVKIFREAQFPHAVDYVEITYLALKDTQAALIWHTPGTPQEEIVQLRFQFTRTMVAETVKIDTGWFSEWSSHPDLVGLALPQGSDIQLLQLTFTGQSVIDNIIGYVRSYWTFDRFTPYSINFLWGPIITASPVAREQLFTDLPPHGTYANTAWYLLLAASMTLCIAWGWQQQCRRRALLLLMILLGAVWILSDLRMGLEAVSYARADLAKYWMQPDAEKKFRERGDFPVFLQAIQPLLTDRGRYVFLTQFEYPLLGLMRYHTYPSVPVAPEKITEGVDTWVIYERPEISVNDKGQLASEGNPISLPGKVLFEFRPGAFVFRTH
jgi:hypothetical protein